MKKKLIAALTILSVVIIIVVSGCSSSSNESTSGKTTDQAATTTGTSTGIATTNTAEKSELPRKFEFVKGSLPKDVERAINNGNPVIIGFFESNDRISEKIKTYVKMVADDYANQIAYFNYIDDTSKRVTQLSLDLKANYLPHISIIDADKNIVFEKSGLIEKDYLDHEVYNAINKDKSGQ